METQRRALLLDAFYGKSVEGLLRNPPLSMSVRRAETRDQFVRELDLYKPDLVIADYSHESFKGIVALKLVREKDPDLPFIFISRTLGEDEATEVVRIGATDLIRRENLPSIVPAVERALDEVSIRKEQRRQQEKFRQTMESVPCAVVMVAPNGMISYLNGEAERLFSSPRRDFLGKSVESLRPSASAPHGGIPRDAGDDIYELLERNAEGIAILHEDGGIEDSRGLLGYAPAELSGRNWFDLLSPEDRSSARESSLNGQAFECRALHKDGSTRWLDCSAGIPGKTPDLMIVKFRDVTASKAAERALSRLAAIVDCSDDAIIGMSIRGRIESWNRTAEGFFGFSPDEVMGRHISFLMTPAQHAELESMMKSLRRGESIPSFETSRIRKDFSRIHLSVTISPVWDADRNLIGASAIARDVTRQKEAEKASAGLIADLQDALAHIRRLSGLLPMCSWCKKIRDDAGYWQEVESYLSQHAEVDFSHGICPDCLVKFRDSYRKESQRDRQAS